MHHAGRAARYGYPFGIADLQRDGGEGRADVAGGRCRAGGADGDEAEFRGAVVLPYPRLGQERADGREQPRGSLAPPLTTALTPVNRRAGPSAAPPAAAQSALSMVGTTISRRTDAAASSRSTAPASNLLSPWKAAPLSRHSASA